jgi:hypothetical protein
MVGQRGPLTWKAAAAAGQRWEVYCLKIQKDPRQLSLIDHQTLRDAKGVMKRDGSVKKGGGRKGKKERKAMKEGKRKKERGRIGRGKE